MAPESSVAGSPTVTILAAPESTQTTNADGLPSDIDLGKIVGELRTDHVATESADQVPALRQVVAHARDEGHDLNIVVLTDSEPKFTAYRDVAAELQSRVGGTVIVVAPDSVGSASPTFSRVQQENAANGVALSDPAAAAREVYDHMAEPGISWTAVTAVLIVVVVVAAVGARMRTIGLRRRRSAAGHEISSTPTQSAVGAEHTTRAGGGDHHAPTPVARESSGD